MPASTRDLWLVIKAQDQASRALSVFSRSVGNAGNAVRTAQLEVQRANQQNILGQRAQAEALARSEISLLSNEKAHYQNIRATAQATGTNQSFINGINGVIRGIDGEIASQKRVLIGHEQGTQAVRGNISAIDSQIRSLKMADIQAELHGQNLRRLAGIIDGTARAAQAFGFAFIGIGATLSAISAPIDAAIFRIAKLGLETAASYERALASIKAISPAGTDVEALFKRLAKLAIDSPVFNVDDIVNFTQKLTASGIPITQTERLLQSLARIFLVSGMDANRSGEALLAFTQINAKGKLQAEELTRQLGNAMPNALAILSEGMGLTVQQFEEMQKAGDISAEDVFNAIIKIGESGKFLSGTNDVMQTMSAKWQQLKEGFTFNLAEVFRKHSKEIQGFIESLKPLADLIVSEFDRVLPHVIGFLNDLGHGIKKITDWYDKLSPKSKDAVAAILLFGGAIVTFSGGAAILIGTLAAVIGGIIAIGIEAWLAAAAVGAIALAVGGVIAAFALLTLKSKPFRGLLSDIGKDFKRLYEEDIKPTFENIKKSYDKELKPALEKLWKEINEKVIPAFRDFMDNGGKEFLQQMKEIGKTISHDVKDAFETIKWVIENYLIPAIDKAIEFYKKHKKEIDEMVHLIEIAAGWVAKLGVTLTIVFGGTLGVLVISSIVGFIGFVLMAVASILTFIAVVKIIWGWLKSLWEALSDAGDAVRNFGMGIIHWFQDLPKKIGDAINGLGAELYNAGINAVQSLIDGLWAKSNALGSAVGAIAGIIASHFVSHSPPKKGPLSGAGSMFLAGKAAVDMLADGMMSGTKELLIASRNTANMVSPMLSGGELTVPNFGGLNRSSGSSSINQQFNITTQEINPQRHSAELGWLIKNRVGV